MVSLKEYKLFTKSLVRLMETAIFAYKLSEPSEEHINVADNIATQCQNKLNTYFAPGHVFNEDEEKKLKTIVNLVNLSFKLDKGKLVQPGSKEANVNISSGKYTAFPPILNGNLDEMLTFVKTKDQSLMKTKSLHIVTHGWLLGVEKFRQYIWLQLRLLYFQSEAICQTGQLKDDAEDEMLNISILIDEWEAESKKNGSEFKDLFGSFNMTSDRLGFNNEGMINGAKNDLLDAIRGAGVKNTDGVNNIIESAIGKLGNIDPSKKPELSDITKIAMSVVRDLQKSKKGINNVEETIGALGKIMNDPKNSLNMPDDVRKMSKNLFDTAQGLINKDVDDKELTKEELIAQMKEEGIVDEDLIRDVSANLQ